ncbi:MAG: DUF5666 domain-containing protein, partial [Acidobacteriota bacterium]
RTILDIEPGTEIEIKGSLILTTDGTPIIKAVSALIKTSKELTITGALQEVDLAQGRIRVFNRDISLQATTRVFNSKREEIMLANLKAGRIATIDVENQDGRLTAINISQQRKARSSNETFTNLTGIITARTGSIIELADSFLIDIATLDAADSSFKVGAEVSLGFDGKAIVAALDPLPAATGTIRIITVRLTGTLQQVDVSKKTIVLLGQTITTTAATRVIIFGSTTGNTLQQLIVGQSVTVGGFVTDAGVVAKTIFQKQ